MAFSVRESSSWRSLRRRWKQDCAAGSQEESRCWGRGRRWEHVCLSFGSSELSCQICPVFHSWLIKIAAVLRGRKSFMEIQCMQDSYTVFVLEWGKLWGEVTSKKLFFQYLYSTVTASFTGLYLNLCTKSSCVAVYTLMKIIAVPCSAVRQKSPMPLHVWGYRIAVQSEGKNETACGIFPSACRQRVSQIKSLVRPMGLAEIAS